jgi:hypothetical protein
MGKDFLSNGLWKQAEVAIIISDKTAFKSKLVRKDKEGHFTLIKGTVHQEEITIINIDVPNIDKPNLIKQTLLDLQAQIDPQHKNSEWLQYPMLTNSYNIQTKKKKKPIENM